MTGRIQVTDTLLYQVLTDLSQGPDASPLVSEVLRDIQARPQQRPGWFGLSTRRTMLAMAAVGLMVVLLAGAIAFGTGILRPKPTPFVLPQPSTVRTTAFIRTFEYVDPADTGLETVQGFPALGLAGADALEAMRRLYEPCTDPQGCSYDTFGGTPVPLTAKERDAYDQRLAEWNARIDVSMIGFTAGGADGDRGVIVALPGVLRDFWCFSGTGQSTPEQTLARWEELGLHASGQRTTVVDGHRALAVVVDNARCPTSHATERTGLQRVPGELILVDADGETVAIAIWSETAAALDAWLPVATDFVNTIHFVTGPVTSEPPQPAEP